MKTRITSYDLITVENSPICGQGRYKVHQGITRKIDFMVLGPYKDNQSVLLKSSAQLKRLIKHR